MINITFISKILERIVAFQLIAYFDANDLLPSCQSGFRKNHSTETLLIRLLSDLYDAIDVGHISLLALFDVSSAYDCVDHHILLQCLSISFGLIGSPLEWLRSYLSERTNSVTFGLSKSAWVPAPFGVPQGSVLGPLLYILYTSEVGALLTSCGVLHQLYADDVQAYNHCPPEDAVAAVRQMCNAMDNLSCWLASNVLLLNTAKTQFIWLGSRIRLLGIDRDLVAETFPHVSFFDSVRDLGIILDQELRFSLHINQITRGCYYQLRQLQVVSRSLSQASAATLIHAFVTSRLDHCCSILVGLPLVLIARLDRVLRSAARLIGRISKYAPVSLCMRDTLHWLLILQRIRYRLTALVWKCLVGSAPAYLRELCCPVADLVGRRVLRSSSRALLLIPRSYTSIKQRRAFSVTGPAVWNDLPFELRLWPKSNTTAFLKCLKSYLFRHDWTGSASE